MIGIAAICKAVRFMLDLEAHESCLLVGSKDFQPLTSRVSVQGLAWCVYGPLIAIL
jgi:hypothetical protein